MFFHTNKLLFQGSVARYDALVPSATEASAFQCIVGAYDESEPGKGEKIKGTLSKTLLYQR